MTETIYSGGHERWFGDVYGSVNILPDEWTDSPSRALEDAYKSAKYNKSRMVVFVLEGAEIDGVHFDGVFDYIEGVRYISKSYRCKVNPFATLAERDKGVHIYTQAGMEEFLKQHLPEEEFGRGLTILRHCIKVLDDIHR